MRTEDPVSTEPRNVKATRRDDAVRGDSVKRGGEDGRRADGRAELDDRTPEEQGYGYGV